MGAVGLRVGTSVGTEGSGVGVKVGDDVGQTSPSRVFLVLRDTPRFVNSTGMFPHRNALSRSCIDDSFFKKKVEQGWQVNINGGEI